MVTLHILINDLLDMCLFSNTLSCEGTDCLIMQEKVITYILRIAKNATITHYTGQPIWHLEEEAKNDDRNMKYRRQYCL